VDGTFPIRSWGFYIVKLTQHSKDVAGMIKTQNSTSENLALHENVPP
jgi:hypothetical protein